MVEQKLDIGKEEKVRGMAYPCLCNNKTTI